MARLELTINEAKAIILKSLGFSVDYRPDADILISSHSVEIINGERPRLESSSN